MDNFVSFDDLVSELLARGNEANMRPRLEPMRLIMDLLANPQKNYPIIHITGTNGKTSTARMIESLLDSYGLRTGRYTSPHLNNLTERICLNGIPVSEELFVDTWNYLIPYLDIVEKELLGSGQSVFTFFEILTIMGFLIFSDSSVDVVVLEVGVGGSWDATNIADASVAVFCPISLDHQNYLGNDLSDIVSEKLGILKQDSIAVVAQQEESVVELFVERAASLDSRLLFENRDFSIISRFPAVGGQMINISGIAGVYEDVFLGLLGEHQSQNAVVAVAAVEAFIGGGSQPFSGDILQYSFQKVSSPGRLEVARLSPTILVDSAHNHAGSMALVKAVEENFNFSSLVGIVGFLDDKDVYAMLEELEKILSFVIVTAPISERALAVDDLFIIAEDVFGGSRVKRASALDLALEYGVSLAEEDESFSGGVLVCGSITLVAEAKVLLGS